MTEAKGQTCTDPQQMLDLLRGKASERKLRLFACACCRQFRDQQQVIGAAIQTAEHYAETGKSKAALKRARQSVKAVRHQIPCGDKTRYVEWAALWLAEVAASENAFGGVGSEVVRLTSLGIVPPDVQLSLCGLGHDILGNPFRPVTLDTSWLDSDVISLAQTIYDTRTFDRMPELANVLENKGCTDTAILEHCRGPGPHVLGCWVVDLILRKK
jgi:hypothetical protein